jgi:exodeoxyribonuclease-3
MRILSWNVNGIRALEKKGFLEWIQSEAADIVCIQETKATPTQLSPTLLSITNNAGKTYTSYWANAEKPGYSGVGLYTIIPPLNIHYLGKPEFDREGRVLIAEFQDFALINAYFPNSQEGGARLEYKLAFCAAMLETCNTLVHQGKAIILCGDYNIAHTPIDLARPTENEGNAGYLPEERAWMTQFLASGYIDTFRHFHPGESGHYTWWSYRTRAREKNIGWRIDYFCVNSGFLPDIHASLIRSDVYGSDHCPIELQLKE